MSIRPPRGYSWFPVWSGTLRLNEYALCRGTEQAEVARVAKRIDGAGWFLQINRHLPHAHRTGGQYRTLEAAMRSAEAWAGANADRLP